jgi:hypothetical protein
MNRKSIALLACLVAAPGVASAQSAGMTRVQIYALQQQLKEECGLAHTSGRMDAATRSAVARCNKKYGTNSAWSLANAMNLGFDASSSGSGSSMSGMSGMSMSGTDMTMHDSTMEMRNVTMRANRARRRAATAERATLSAQTDSLMRADRDAHGYNQGKTKKSDTTYSATSDSLLRAGRGLPAGPTKPKKKN